MESKRDFEKRKSNMSIECKTLFVSVWDAVMKLTAEGKYHFSSDIRNFKTSNYPHPHFAYTFKINACVCRTSENCKLLVLQGKCKIELFLSPGDRKKCIPRITFWHQETCKMMTNMKLWSLWTDYKNPSCL